MIETEPDAHQMCPECKITYKIKPNGKHVCPHPDDRPTRDVFQTGDTILPGALAGILRGATIERAVPSTEGVTLLIQEGPMIQLLTRSGLARWIMSHEIENDDAEFVLLRFACKNHPWENTIPTASVGWLKIKDGQNTVRYCPDCKAEFEKIQ